jgi:ankyrin repeat protein
MEKPTAVALPDDPNYNDESRDTPVPPAHAAAAGGEDDQQDTKQHITTTIYSTTTKGEKETMDVKEDKEHQTEGGEQQEEEPEMDFDLSCHDQLVEELMDKNPSLDTIKNLVTNDGGAGGKDAVLHQDNDGFNVLHYACRKNMSFEVIELLVQVGGKDIVLQQDEDGENSLHLACANKHISFEVIELLVNVGGKDAVLQQDNDGENAIMLVETYYACRNEYISFKIIEILVKVGGKQAVLHQDNDGFNALHYACRKNMSFEVIELLVQVGGKDVIVAPDDDGFNALYHACANKHISLEVIELLVRVGGNDVVLQQDEDGKNALHLAIQKELDYKIIDFFVKVGEHDAILAQDNDGFNALHYACEKKCSIKIIKRLVKGGGRNAILGRTLFGQNPLHIACKYNETDIEVVKYLVEQAGEEIETKMLEVDPESIYEASIRVGKERAVLERTDDEDRRNTIEVALDSNLSIETIKFLIDSVTSKEGILQKNAKDWNTLHSAVAGGTFTEEVYKSLIDKGGTDILKAETSEGKLPIDLCFSAPKFNYQAYSAITAKWLELDPKLYTVPNSVVNGMYKKRDVEISKSGDKLLDSDFFRGILNTFMIRHFSIIVLMMDLYAQTAIVGIVSFGSIGSCTSNTRTFVGFIVGLSLSVTWQLFREIMQESTTQFRKYVKDPYNWIDICQIVLIIMLIKDMCAINKREESLCYIASSRAILSLATIFAWLQFLIVWSDLSYNVSVFVAALFQVSLPFEITNIHAF